MSVNRLKAIRDLWALDALNIWPRSADRHDSEEVADGVHARVHTLPKMVCLHRNAHYQETVLSQIVRAEVLQLFEVLYTTAE